jgi:hypothetical protein
MLKSLNNIDKKLNKLLNHQYIKYPLLLILLLSILYVKKIDILYLKFINKDYILILIGLFIIYLVYSNTILALTLTLCIIVFIQEYNNRLAVLHISNENNDILKTSNDNLDKKDNSSIQDNNVKPLVLSDNEKINDQDMIKHMRTIPSSTYGYMEETELTKSDNYKYEQQIGHLGVTSELNNIYTNLDDKYQNYPDLFLKVNMDQNKKENFSNMDINNDLEKKIYDHPSSKTITENLRVKNIDYVNDKNLNMIQSNRLNNPPCAVESICGSFNAQSF